MKSVRNILSKFKWAFEGVYYGLRYDRSIQIQTMIASVVIALSIFLELNNYDFIVVIILCVIVLITEFINSAIENLSDYVCEQEYSMKIKRVKDLAAGAVLVASVSALVIGIMIFYKYII